MMSVLEILKNKFCESRRAHVLLAEYLFSNAGRFANVQFANVLRRYLAWQWIKERRIIIKFVSTLAKL